MPTIPGIGSALAVLVGLTGALLGFLLDSSHGSELTRTFSVAYFASCVLAALAVRNRGIFTTIVQPPLLLFVSVPLAYYHFKNSSTSVKDLVLNVAIPLIDRFPLMVTTTAVVLVIGAVRLYFYRAELRKHPRTPRVKPTPIPRPSAPVKSHARPSGRRPEAPATTTPGAATPSADEALRRRTAAPAPNTARARRDDGRREPRARLDAPEPRRTPSTRVAREYPRYDAPAYADQLQGTRYASATDRTGPAQRVTAERRTERTYAEQPPVRYRSAQSHAGYGQGTARYRERDGYNHQR